jgi:hypothetical protein
LARNSAASRLLRDEVLGGDPKAGLKLLRSLPHGHVAAALGMLRKVGPDGVLSQGGRQPAREVALCIAMMVARLIDPSSKLATARLRDAETATFLWAGRLQELLDDVFDVLTDIAGLAECRGVRHSEGHVENARQQELKKRRDGDAR